MLTTTVELWPFGDKDAAKRLVTINIANVGRNAANPHRSDYVYTIDEPTPLFGEPIHIEGVLLAYDREGSAIDILRTVLELADGPVTGLNSSDKLVAERLRNKTLKK